MLHLQSTVAAEVAMTPVNSELKKISAEIGFFTIKKQKLQERKNILAVYQEQRNHTEFGQTEGVASSQQEMNQIDEKLTQLSAWKAEVEKNFDLGAKDTENSNKEESLESSEKIDPGDPGSGLYISCVEPPPSFSAPAVILDVEKLPPWPSRTQCPECRQFVVTETSASVGSVTWMACTATALMCCVFGCCLIPFCLDTCKTITHKCPLCRSTLTVIEKL